MNVFRQIEPPQMKDQDEGDMKLDIDSYQLTMEELEGKKKEKGEGDKAKTEGKKPEVKKTEDKGKTEAGKAAAGGDQKKEGEEGEEFYLAADAATVIHSKSFMNATSINVITNFEAPKLEVGSSFLVIFSDIFG